MNQPTRLGQTIVAPCSWCRQVITKVAVRYDFCRDLFWDESACTCGELGAIVARMGDRAEMGRRHRGAS